MADDHTYTFKAKVWLYAGPTPWHFVTLPKKLGVEIQIFHAQLKKNFGSIGVKATIGKTSWKTSIFSDKKSGSFVLPLKADVRKKEKIAAGRTVKVVIAVFLHGGRLDTFV